MATVRARTFPGVYTTITDASFLTPAESRFRVGLIGVAAKGPLNVPTHVLSLKDFRRQFGKSLGAGYYLADAAAILADLSDGTYVLRVAHEYSPVDNCAASGTSGAYKLYTPKAAVFDPANFDSDPTTNLYLRVTQTGLPSTVNAIVASAPLTDSGGAYILLRSNTGDPALSANYTSANIAYSELDGASNNAESTVYAYTYEAAPIGAGTISGDKSSFQLLYTGGGGVADWEVGGVYKITETNKVTTQEIRVKRVLADTPVVVEFETSDIAQVGYQAVSLQDSYSAATAYKIDSTAANVAALYLMAASPGTWANGAASTTGLFVKVRPGSKAGTKMLEVYEDSALVETFDNLTNVSTSANYYNTAINGVSSYITVSYVGNGDPANSTTPWDSALTLLTTPKSMPKGAINNGQAGGTHGSFANGANGANITDADIIGTVDPSDDSLTGIKAFEDTEQAEVDFICAPGISSFANGVVSAGNISVAVMQEMARVAAKVNAIALADVPRGLTAREAIDWHNGQGLYANRGGRIDSRNLAVYWNWFTMTDRFATDPTVTKVVPPTLAALRCEAYTFDSYHPWEAAAGETRGLIPEALTLDYTKISADTKNAMYGNGNSVNPIILSRGTTMLYGERTMQVAESKLSVVHSNVLIHYIVNNMAAIARRFVFDPNDIQLLTQLKLVFTEFLDKVKNERGIEEYNLVIDETNNNAESRNRREVNVDLYVIPTDTVERVYINAIVRESGANLQSVNV
jgi:hypothetical protein